MGALNQSIKAALRAAGAAPIFACRAWVSFDGTGTVAIRASGNVSSVTDNGVGNYIVNFSTAMLDDEYAVSLSSGRNSSAQYCVTNMESRTSSSLNIHNANFGAALVDNANVYVAIFR